MNKERINSIGVRIKQGMRRQLKEVYGKRTHYWPKEMKILLLAANCVDIVVKYSTDASLIYQQIIDVWDRPDCQALLKKNIAIPFNEIRAWEKAVT